ncbi:MAG: hypothetical protein JWN44_7177 [Myxococcales bacterium]|nr:hypothetical protein [Myxococcales bacterium]
MSGAGGDDLDLDARQLCDDGACLGVLVGGKCNVCGVATVLGSPRDPGSGSSSDAGAPRDPSSGSSVGAGGSAAARSGPPRDPGTGHATDAGGARMASADGETFDPDRALCDDGACTGVIGSDGKCKECGRSAAS